MGWLELVCFRDLGCTDMALVGWLELLDPVPIYPIKVEGESKKRWYSPVPPTLVSSSFPAHLAEDLCLGNGFPSLIL